MGKVKVKLDLSKLEEEFMYESRWINSQKDVQSEIAYSDLIESIMSKIEILEEVFVEEETDNKN